MEGLLFVAIPATLPWFFAWKWGKQGAWGSALVIVLLLFFLTALQSCPPAVRFDCGQGIAFLQIAALIIAFVVFVSAALAAYVSRW